METRSELERRPMGATGRRFGGLAVATLVAALSGARAAPAPDLKGATLCLSPLLSVSVTVDSGASLKLAGLDTQVYAEARRLLRAGGVPYQEAQVCRRSSAGLSLSVRVRPIQGSAALETQVSASVEDGRAPGGSSWLGGRLRWSAVEYGQVSPTAAKVTAGLWKDTRASLGRLVDDWQAANR